MVPRKASRSTGCHFLTPAWIVTSRLFWLLLSFVLHVLVVTVNAYDNGLGLTPPMGWNSWNRFRCDIDEDLILEMARAIQELGLQDLGYNYINLDDCWQTSRNATGYIVEDPVKFHSGMRALSDRLHDLGFWFGLYSSAGTNTCARRPGSLGFESRDAASYKEFNVDYLKYDNCYGAGVQVQKRYQDMHDALNASGHSIFFSMCEWGVEDPATWARPVGNSWRTTGDINPSWSSVTSILDQNDRWHEYAGPGGWNDPDMLEVGNGDLTPGEQRSHFTLWCLSKAPLLLGSDVRNVKASSLEIISNKEVIALNQDPLGVQGFKRTSSKGLEVWAGPLDKGHIAVVLFNRSPHAAPILASWADIGLSSKDVPMQVRDLWKHEDLGVVTDSVTALVESHDVVALRLSPVELDDHEAKQQ